MKITAKMYSRLKAGRGGGKIVDKQKSSVRKYIAGILVLAMLLPIFSGFATTVKAEEPVRKD